MIPIYIMQKDVRLSGLFQGMCPTLLKRANLNYNAFHALHGFRPKLFDMSELHFLDGGMVYPCIMGGSCMSAHAAHDWGCVAPKVKKHAVAKALCNILECSPL